MPRAWNRSSAAQVLLTELRSGDQVALTEGRMVAFLQQILAVLVELEFDSETPLGELASALGLPEFESHTALAEQTSQLGNVIESSVLLAEFEGGSQLDAVCSFASPVQLSLIEASAATLAEQDSALGLAEQSSELALAEFDSDATRPNEFDSEI